MMEMWKALVSAFKAEMSAEELTIYLRSGDRIAIDRVVDWKFKNQGNEIVSVEIHQSKRARTRLLIKTLDLSQIIAITAR